MNRFSRWLLGVCLAVSVSVPAFSQESPNFPPLSIADQLGGLNLGGLTGGDKITFSGAFTLVEGGRSGSLTITAEVEPGWHVYSLTQQPGGPQRSVLKLTNSDQASLTGKFQADAAPQVKQYEYYDIPVEEHEGTVVWTAPIQLAEGVDPASVDLEVRFDGQVCQEGACIPIMNRSISALFAGFAAAAPEKSPSIVESGHINIRGFVEPSVVAPGGKATLTIEAELAPGWHVYAYADKDPQEVSKPTLIVLEPPVGFSVSKPAPSSAPHVEDPKPGEDQSLPYHESTVRWTLDITIPTDASHGSQTLAGYIGYQVCSQSQCDRPAAVQFQTSLEVGAQEQGSQIHLEFTDAKYVDVARRADGSFQRAAEPTSVVGFNKDRIKITDQTKEQPLWAAIGIALAGGFILNFMPCVLPVIGLKIMSFVQQAGESRARAFTLNLWYSLGLMSVFMVLATLAAVWSVGWGQQNQSSIFNIIMASVVFTMGLSFLGVWEIPIPGFVGSGKANELAAQEGVSGAFAKGVVTTILAVPCSGPLVATALTWCAGKPPALVYMTFGFMGLGMAFPYLLIGAYPQLMRFMPKPGAWMDTFKQAMGFVLLGTVIWIMSYLPWPQVLPTLAFLFGLWAACWWVGRTPMTEDFPVKARAWVGAIGFATGIGLFAFAWFGDVMGQRFTAAVEREIASSRFDATQTDAPAGETPVHVSGTEHLPWQPFSIAKLTSLTSENKTVMVDFTADWCPTCKVLEANVLNTHQVRETVEQLGVVPLLADWTNPNAEISEMLELLGSKQIPVLAIFPGDRPNEPIVLRGWYSVETLVQKLHEAGGMSAGETAAVSNTVNALVRE